MDRGVVACWLRRSKAAKSSLLPKLPDLFIFRDIFSAGPKCCKTKKSPPINSIMCACCRQFPSLSFNCASWKTSSRLKASVCYRLLRYLNSAAFGIQNEVYSIRHALTLLGEREVRRWIRLVATLTAGEKRSSELLVSAMVRARFCELLAPKCPTASPTCF